MGVEGGAIDSIPGNEGRIAQAWVNVRGGLRVFSVYFWHSEGWTPRNEALPEAVVKQSNTTGHPWLVACGANMCPEIFEKISWFQRDRTHVVSPKEVSTCRSKVSKVEWMERTYDYVIACNSLSGNISQLKAAEDFESRPHKAVSFVVERESEIQECNEQKLPKVLPGYSGGREEEEEEKDSRERQVRYGIAQEVVAGIK